MPGSRSRSSGLILVTVRNSSTITCSTTALHIRLRSPGHALGIQTTGHMSSTRTGLTFADWSAICAATPPKIPHQRLVAHDTTTKVTQLALGRVLAGTHLGHLSCQIDNLATNRQTIALSKAQAPTKPTVNREFINTTKGRRPGEVLNTPSRRC